MASTWDPQQYERFRDERSQPFYDLLALVRARPGMRVVDLGCGTGELTGVMHQRLEAQATLGLDNSESMLAKAAALSGGGLSFEQRDAAGVTGPYDLIFSNAALHWLPDHPALWARLTAALAPDGQLAVQMPANHDYPSHVVADAVAAEEPFLSAMGGYTRTTNVLPPEVYAQMLDRLGYREQHVRLQVYVHHLAKRDDVVEWVKGTLLTDYQRRMPAALFERFLARYRERLLPQLENAQPFFYPFKRILMWATR